MALEAGRSAAGARTRGGRSGFGQRQQVPTRGCSRIAAASNSKTVTLVDYGAGNVRSVRNAIKKLGYQLIDAKCAQDIANAEKVLFPGVGSFGQARDMLQKLDFTEALKEYILLLFEGSDESGGVEGLGIVPGRVGAFEPSNGLPVPHIGWNTLEPRKPSCLLSDSCGSRLYFVHSFRAMPQPDNADWVLSTSSYGDEFVSAIGRGNVYATQFHPEKSGAAGLAMLDRFLSRGTAAPEAAVPAVGGEDRGLAKRVIACLDVRTNNDGDLVVTKGDQYDVREATQERQVRNLGKPVELAERYFQEGADEVTFLNITGFRDFPLGDLPMLDVLRQSSERVFVPLTVGGGIREFTDAAGRFYSSLEVAAEYFRSGADKVSIGSDAVEAAMQLQAAGGRKTGETAIEQISQVYGKQAVVVSIDPRRVYVHDPADTPRPSIKTATPGPNGEEFCWWECTVKGGREGRDIDAVELAQAVEALGAGEILLNCIDRDGQGNGFDTELVDAVSRAVTIPVIASSGAGAPEHFSEVFDKTAASAALAAGIFHRQEVEIADVKQHMSGHGIPTRL